jgi:DNA segregation ATPase FtsK/SpoIIIE, S-DNA-T family
MNMSTEKRNKFRAADNADTLEVIEESIEKNDVSDFVDKGAIKKNRPKSNNKKSEVKKEPVESVTTAQRWQQMVLLYRNERTQKIMGLLLILFSAYLFIALISYFFSWDIDQDKVLAGPGELFAPETKVVNWLGKVGALISHWFMYKAFGTASFILVPVIFMFGLQKVIQRNFISIATFNAKWLFMMVWASLMLSYIFSEKYFFMGGGFGYFINEKISGYVGNIGLLALIIFSMVIYLVLTINISFRLPERKKLENVPAADEPQEEIVNPANNTANVFREEDISLEEESRLLNFEVITKSGSQEQDSEIGFQVIDTIEVQTNNIDENIPVVEEIAPLKAGEPVLEITQPGEEPAIMEDENKAAQLVEQFGEYDPTLDLGSYKFPHFELLNDYGSIHSKVNQEELIANKNRILSTLKNYGIEIDKIMATVGPTVTLYEIVPAAGVRISKIKNLEDDIALSLAALGIRIIAPIPGKGTIGIEVPNQTPEMVPMRNILASEKFNNSQFELPIALGKTISNEIFIADLAKMPHLLMAGATGQGKSVGLNAVLVSLLYKKHPSQVKFVLVDPKKVELTLFNKIERHFLAKLPNSEDAIITDNTKVIHTLNSLCIEMDNRYALLQDAQVRNIKEYNAKFVARKLNPNDGHKFLPYIVLVVDEFADLIMTAGKEVETPIARLAQLARAIGIHLIIATQRPSVNIITGTIKANFPARIAFRVTSKIDSRTILDSGGADQLIGRGDMLLSTGNDLIRIQCAFVDTPEVEKITEFIGNQRAYPSAFMLPEYIGEDGDAGKEEVDLSERDKMFDDAAKLVVQFQQGSASFLQRKLKLGYNRAGRIVDQLEAAGIIGPFEGSKAREVITRDMAQLDDILQKLRNK